MAEDDQADDFERLHDLIAGTEDLKGFLDGMARFAAQMMTRTTGTRIECAVTLRRRKHNTTIAGSSAEAIRLDRIEQQLDEGPCVEALETSKPVVLEDVSDSRWPVYSQKLAEAGCRSALGVPLELGTEAAAVLNFFAPATGLFTDATIADADVFAEMASRTLRLAVRIATADQLAENLKSAIESRTVIDLACGIIMAQNHCSQDEAISILKRASSGRNQKLHSVAEKMVNHVSGLSPATTHFDD